ncbi:hypothetical protein FOA52_001033 [Chlamydomonas sp. UWO 241]|nr:hypothetical protein FOA52_001033 [Chlamydomonas sp. UWO 241]
MMQGLWSKLGLRGKKQQDIPVFSGTNSNPPAAVFQLVPLDDGVIASHSGPGGGIAELPECAEGLPGVNFAEPAPWACGSSISMYEHVGDGGGRAGDPIADCFSVLAYSNHTVIAVADGVAWGLPAKRAATAAVLGASTHLHATLPGLGCDPGSDAGAADGDERDGSGGGCARRPVSSDDVFRALLASLGPAQAAVLAAAGTMTTLVLTVVARLAVPLKHGSLKAHAAGGAFLDDSAQPSSSLGSPQPGRPGSVGGQPGRPGSVGGGSSSSGYFTWVAMTVAVGDSPAYVWRHTSGEVQELTAAVHSGNYRDPRWTPGALGYAIGEEPDLDNLVCSVSLLDEGDVVFLTSDGVADNFDPFLLKMARQACGADVWTGGGLDGGEGEGPPPIMSAEEAHARQLEMLSGAVRVSCSHAAASRRSMSDPVAYGSPLMSGISGIAAVARVSWPWGRSRGDSSIASTSTETTENGTGAALDGTSAAADGSTPAASAIAAMAAAAALAQHAAQRKPGQQQQHGRASIDAAPHERGSNARHARTHSSGAHSPGAEPRPSGDHSANRPPTTGSGDPSTNRPPTTSGGEHARSRSVSSVSVGHKTGGGRGATDARTLVDGLLAHVEAQTAGARAWAEARNCAAAAKQLAKEQSTVSEEKASEPSLSTDRKAGKRAKMPPGKMDHATRALHPPSNAKPAVGGIGVEPRGSGVLRVLFTVASDAVADTVVRWRHELRRCVDSTAVFDVLSDREEAQHQALWPAFLAAKVAGKRAQFHRARLVVDGERVPAPAC